ncbi:DUF3180 domain-containing protein [Cellulomonas soli]|uniref:DUF3180 domain-containing protein n=1 Tax=Cellulomonas soli TaxID=931535 RepID=UPI003F8475A7
MHRTRWQTLLLLASAVAVSTWVVLRAALARGAGLPTVPWLVVAVELVIAAVVLSMGWAVRQFLRGRRPTLNPIRAARTAVLAKASCYTGALLAGWYGGQVLTVLRESGGSEQLARAASAGAATVGAVVLAVVGLVVEWFCQIPPPEDSLTQRADEQAPDPAAG